MLYALYQTAADVMLPMRLWSAVAGQGFALGGQSSAERWRAAGALCEMLSRAALSHRRPAFDIHEITTGNRPDRSFFVEGPVNANTELCGGDCALLAGRPVRATLISDKE